MKKSKKCLFIYPAYDHESLAIEYLSAVLKKAGHKTDLILHNKEEKNFRERLSQRIREFNPDFILFSVMTDDYIWACKVAKHIKKIKNIPTIFGGIHTTACPEEVISRDFVDYIVIGEGEEAIVELVENPNKTNIKNVWSKKEGKIIKNKLRPLIEDLDILPYPDKGLFFKEAPFLGGETYYFMTGRGCPFNCSYCFNNHMKRLYTGCKWLRQRSVDNVINELKEGKKKFNYHLVYFGDDCFTHNKEWLREFFQRYKEEINAPFKALAHPGFMDKEVVSLLKKGGCVKIQLGVQTPVEEIRKEVCKRNDTNKVIFDAVREIKKQKIFVQIDHIHGLPLQTMDRLKQGIGFYIDLKPDVIGSFFLQYYPNNEIIELGKQQGDIDDKFIQDTIKGHVKYSKVVAEFKKNKEVAAMSIFFFWIPVLPRPISRFLWKTGLYTKIFRTDKLNKIPYFLRHLQNKELRRLIFNALIRKIKTKKHYSK